MYYRATVRDSAGTIRLTSDLVRVFWTNQESDIVDAGLRLEGYPCGDATAPARTDLSCDKPGFTVLLVGILGNGATSLPAGMSLFFEQAPAGGSWAPQPPGCSSPPTAVNCRLTIQTSNRGSARAGFQGPTGTVMYYRVTLRNNAAIAQGVSNVIRVFWSNQAPGPVPPGSTPPGSTPPGPPPPGPPPPGPGIHVVSGTYGGNCGQPEGNVTRHLAASCDGRASCNYRVDHTVIGDPAFLCKKTYVAKWRCGGGTQINEASVPAEATAKTVTLSCP
jgi:hypothetical protein